MPLEDELGPPIPEHQELPEGMWWSCAFPERPAESGKVQFRRECRRCLPAYMAMKFAANGRSTTRLGTALGKSVEGTTPAEWRAWFMREGEHAAK